jgi:hypothetical protein
VAKKPLSVIAQPLVAQGYIPPLTLIFLINNGIMEKMGEQIRGYEWSEMVFTVGRLRKRGCLKSPVIAGMTRNLIKSVILNNCILIFNNQNGIPAFAGMTRLFYF